MPPRFNMNGALTEMRSLSCAGAGGLLAVGFRIRGRQGDRWTNRFTNFKYGSEDDRRKGVQTLARACLTARFPDHSRKVVVGAISSGAEGLSKESPVYALGRTVALFNGWEWKPQILSKARHRPLKSLDHSAERDSEVHGTYRSRGVAGAVGLFVIVDDFATRGATFSEIRRALLEASPGWSIVNLALAKNENDHFWDGNISNDHVPAELDRVWEKA